MSNITTQHITLPKDNFETVYQNKCESLIVITHLSLEAGFLTLKTENDQETLVWIKDFIHTTARGLSMKLNLSPDEIMDKIVKQGPIDLSPETKITYLNFLSPERTQHIFVQGKMKN